MYHTDRQNGMLSGTGLITLVCKQQGIVMNFSIKGKCLVRGIAGLRFMYIKPRVNFQPLQIKLLAISHTCNVDIAIHMYIRFQRQWTVGVTQPETVVSEVCKNQIY